MAALTADLAIHSPELFSTLKPQGLAPHGHADQVRALVGEDTWREYFKFAGERDPFDRIIWLWSWRQHHRGIRISFDNFSSAIADGEPSRVKKVAAENWSNWPIYTIEDLVVADEVIKYENLLSGLKRVFLRLGIPFDGALPHAKRGIRNATDRVSCLSEKQIEMISSLFSREISNFKYTIPECKQK